MYFLYDIAVHTFENLRVEPMVINGDLNLILKILAMILLTLQGEIEYSR